MINFWHFCVSLVIKHEKSKCFLTHWDAPNEGIAGETLGTAAHWIVIDNLTTSANTASSGTWINAFLIAASLTGWTIRTDDALGSAGWGTAEISDDARAHSDSVVVSALTVWSTRRWFARRCDFGRC